MKLAEFVAENSFWFWTCFYAGLGFALASVLISAVSIVHFLRRSAEQGVISNAVAELCVVALFFPGMLGILAIGVAIGLTREKAVPGSLWFFSVTLAVFTGLAWCISLKLNASVGTKAR